MEITEPLKIQDLLAVGCTSHAYFILETLDLKKEPLSIPDLINQISTITRGSINLRDQSVRIPTHSLAQRGLLREIPMKYGKRSITKYELTKTGLKYLEAFHRFLEALE